MKEINELQTIATQVRRDILRMTTAAKSGHPGGSLGTTEWFTAMQFNLMDHDPAHFTMSGEGQDMLFVSQGHITPVIYSTMARRLPPSAASAHACRGIPPRHTVCPAYAWPPARWARASP